VCPWNRRGQDSGVRIQDNHFRPMIVKAAKLGNGNWKLETGNSKLQSGQQLSERPAIISRQSGNLQSSIVNRQFSAPDTRHPAPDTFSLFNPPLEALAAMTEDEFRKTFAQSPIKRAKYRGWLRNLCVAMGNSGDACFIPKLKELAAHSDPMVREHAEWALEQVDEAS
jgi:epoxyqueuosine reductase QueG